MADQFDDSGLVPGSAPWQLPPDAGMEAPGWIPPVHGGDVKSTAQRPSQEPRQAVAWPRIPPMSMTTDTGQG